MEDGPEGGASGGKRSPIERDALNSTILEYYKKFGCKRDLEQYFSLNTAQGEVADVSSLFWRRMKAQENSDSGEKSRESSLELCRIRIQCSAEDLRQSGSQEDSVRTKSDSESPPIITEDVQQSVEKHSAEESVKSDDDNKSVKSDDNNSPKSIDVTLDTSANKVLSPTSSITSQRKLEWDSLADVGYANESDKKTSASGLSTLERLALKQQYTNNDTHQDNLMGMPTAHSTPHDEENISKSKKGSKTTKIYRKDVDCVQFTVPQSSNTNPSQSINVNLTKHISFNVDSSGGVSVEKAKKDYSISPENKSFGTEITPHMAVDKEIQTSLAKTKDKSVSSGETSGIPNYGQAIPVLINLNNLKKRNRRKKVTTARKKLNMKKKAVVDKENIPVLEKSGEQVSEAESFEYMPGHIYNQNQMKNESSRSNEAVGNKSSLESSGALTTDSSKGSKHSFTKDLENNIKMLRATLNKRYNDKELKQKLIEQVVQKLIDSNYRDDESTTDFLSGLSFTSKNLDLEKGSNAHTTTSTSDNTNNNTAENRKLPPRPKKSILRVDKFNSKDIASTSQSVPNLTIASNSENPVSSKLKNYSNSYSDSSSKEKTSSDPAFAKTSSEELYQRYLDALRREEAYKRHLRDKEHFLKQKLVASDNLSNRSSGVVFEPPKLDIKSRIRLKAVMNDLTRNNYNDGSGDASKLEGSFSTNRGTENNHPRSQRSHSVFTLSSSGNSDPNKKHNLKKNEIGNVKAGQNKDEMHYCCCPHHFGHPAEVTDSSVQVDTVNKKSPRQSNVATGPCPSKYKNIQPITRIVSDDNTGDIKYLCLMCNKKVGESTEPSDDFLIYKCSRLNCQSVFCNVLEVPAMKHQSVSEKTNPSKGCQTCLKPLEPKFQDVKYVHEAIRVIQTDITIDPQISNPQVSDVRITSETDCARLVREQIRQVSKSSVDTYTDLDQNGMEIYGDKNQPSTSKASPSKVDKSNGVQSTSDVGIKVIKNYTDSDTCTSGLYDQDGGYTIPIAGTKMTLKVKDRKNPAQNIETGNELRGGIDSTDMNVQYGKTDFEKKTVGFQTDDPVHPLDIQQTRNPQQEAAHDRGSNKMTRKTFLRSNTFDVIDEISSSNIDEFKNLERERPNTYPKRTQPCPCPQANDCENLCDENADCRYVEKNDASCGPSDDLVNIEYGKKDDDRPVNFVGNLNTCDPCSCIGIEDGNDPCCSKTIIQPQVQQKTTTNESPRNVYSAKNACDSNSINRAGLGGKDGTCNVVEDKNMPLDKPPCDTDKQKKTHDQVHNTEDTRRTQILDFNSDVESYMLKNSGSVKGDSCKRCENRNRGLSSNSHSRRPSSTRNDSPYDCRSSSKCAGCDCCNACKGTFSKKELEGDIIYFNEDSTSSRSAGTEPVSVSLLKTGSSDIILDVIKNITKRYSKEDLGKNLRKKRFKEIMSIFNYLLDTDSTDTEAMSDSKNVDKYVSDTNAPVVGNTNKTEKWPCSSKGVGTEDRAEREAKTTCDKGVQLSAKKPSKCCPESSDLMTTSEHPCTSSDTATCKILNMIRKECEKYHRRCGKRHRSPKCECSSTNTSCDKCRRTSRHSRNVSAHCDDCNKVHYCDCRRPHRCKVKSRTPEKPQKKCIAYNLIIQTSDSMFSEEQKANKCARPLKNIVVKVPPRKPSQSKVPFKELEAEIEKKCSPRSKFRNVRSRSLPKDSFTSTDDYVKEAAAYTVKDYLEKNRPDFIEQSGSRQNCLKIIKETRADNRAAKRELLSMQVRVEPTLKGLSEADLRHLAARLGYNLRDKKEPPKLISEREMKKHSEKIYKKLPEVLRKKEELKKENIKKTNLLMANIFKKNLQKKTLKGAVNISNYSSLIKI